jgi:hypothetical protein
MNYRLIVCAGAVLALATMGCESTDSGADGGTDAGGTGGGGGGGGGGGSNPMACGFAEPEPNDTRDNATAYTAGTDVTGCIGSSTDVDFYKLSSPADMTGGVFGVSMTDVGEGTLDVKVYTASDNSAILENTYTVDKGGNLYFYWAAAPGADFRISVARFGGFDAAYKYKMKAVYTKAEDAYEPNDTKATATPLTLGTPVMAKLFAGHKVKVVADEAYYDWYKFDVATAGMVNVAVDEVPTNTTVKVELQNALGSAINNTSGEDYNITKGGSVVAGFMVMPGAHSLRIESYSPKPETADRTDSPQLPDNATRSYKLTVSQ